MKRFLPWMTLALSVIVLIGIYMYISSAVNRQGETSSRQRPAAKETPLDVSVITVTASAHAASLQAVGTAQSEQNLTLTAQVSGEVVTLGNTFEVGSRVQQGQTLLTLDNMSLMADLANAKTALASAQLALKEELRQVDQADAEWRSAGLEGDPASDLVLRAPQLAAARANVDAAKAALALAQDNVQKLNITAPFDGILVSKDVALGSYLSSSTQIATVYSTDRVLIDIKLSQQDWKKLPSAKALASQQWPATVRSIDGQESWQGYVKQAGLHVETESGLRSIYIAVDQPLDQPSPLLPGSYVSVSIAGIKHDKLWQLPNSALSQKSQIWYIDQDSRLANFDATPAFVDQHFVYIEAPDTLLNHPQQVLTHPYNSYLTGMLAAPQLRDEP